MSDPTNYIPTIDRQVAAKAGVDLDVVQKILVARLDFLFALGIAHGTAEDAKRGAALRDKYPDLLRPSVVDSAGRSPQTPVTYELEAVVVQLESGASARDVVEVLVTEDELRKVTSDTAAYRLWARKWIGGQ